MQAQAFARSLSDPAYDAPVRIFGPSDGLLSRHASQSWRSLVQGGDGRLWLATATGTAWIDPAGIPINRLAPSLAITKLEGRGVLERDPTAVQLKAGTSDLAISFSALSLGSPERVQVRYRLEGHDEDWVDPGQRRQAFYTNLRPGSYRFQVIAANEDGIWNRNGATLSFTIAPTFLQSIWFKFLCAIGVLGLASAAYLLRMRQVTAKLRDRFQIRIAERERIARELHDTWLQGVQGLMLSFQSVANRLPADSALRASVDGTLDRADNLIVDGRRRLRDLRRRAADTDLGQALADSAREVISSQSEARITIEGTQRPLDPTVAEELLRIAEEAMRNAVQHGDDVEIEVALVYARLELRLVIRDDGPGLPDDVLATGQRSGHFGLQGMQERAERIGARLEISSQPRRGTEVRITLPSLRAYRDGRTFDAARLFERAGLKQPYLPRGRR
jgi:signal transduction histidine kinase